MDDIIIRMVDVPREKLVEAVGQVKSFGNFDVQIQELFGDYIFRVVCRNSTYEIKNQMTSAVVSCLQEYIYTLDETPLAERLFHLLKLRGNTISVAESFTGGGICKRLVEVPGVSAVFYEGLNTYSNQSKIERLGVKRQSLEHFGAVSDEVAFQMANGLLSTGHCDVAVATTGIAGPASDNTNKPVGLCYIAVGTKEQIYVHRYKLLGDRQEITEKAINLALFLVYRHLK